MSTKEKVDRIIEGGMLGLGNGYVGLRAEAMEDLLTELLEGRGLPGLGIEGLVRPEGSKQREENQVRFFGDDDDLSDEE